jgi:hypothetical protein
MNRLARITAIVLLVLAPAITAQEKGVWRAASKPAKTMTGDVAFSGEKITIGFYTFPIAQIRALTLAEIGATFDADTSAGGTGNLFRINVPAARHIVRDNSLCGSDDTQWVASYVSGKALQLAFFSGAAPPVLTPEAMTNATDLCGIFTYSR